MIDDLSDLLGYDYYFASIVELKTLTLDRSNYMVKYAGFDVLFTPKYVLAQLYINPSTNNVTIIGVEDDGVTKDSPLPDFL